MSRIGQQNIPLLTSDDDILAAIDALGSTPDAPTTSAEFSTEPWKDKSSADTRIPKSEFHPFLTDEEAEEFIRLDDELEARRKKSQVSKDGLAKYAKPYVEKSAKNHEIDQHRKTPEGKAKRAAQEKKRHHDEAEREGRVIKTRNSNPTPDEKKAQSAARSREYRKRQKEAAQLSQHPDEA